MDRYYAVFDETPSTERNSLTNQIAFALNNPQPLLLDSSASAKPDAQGPSSALPETTSNKLRNVVWICGAVVVLCLITTVLCVRAVNKKTEK